VLAVLYLQNKGFRLIEVLVLTLIGVVAVSFGIKLVLSKPDFSAMALGCLPSANFAQPRHDLCGHWHFGGDGYAT
jgi:manganese transport protein